MSSQIIFAERTTKEQIEEGKQFTPKFDANGLITVVTQDHKTGEILMVAYMNDEALKKTIEIGEGVYFSRSRQKLWHKGESSGMIQKVKEICTDCDQDAIILKVEMVGGACCHVGYRSCFYRSVPFGKEQSTDAPLELSFTETEKVFDPKEVYGK
jgi:phosphoribosyl-AMP cyclohydrolase